MAANDQHEERDHYRVLGVGRHVGGDRIREAYRDLAWRLHPDRHEPGAGDEPSPAERRVAERRIREVNEAFRVLGEPARRRAYDQTRLASAHSGGGPAGRSATATARPRHRQAEGSGGASRRTTIDLPDDDGDLVPVVGDGVHGLLFSRVVPLMMAGLLFAIVIFSAFAGGGIDDADGVGDATSPPAGCVLGNTLVSCDKPHDGQIVGTADGDQQCPAGSTLRRLATDYCVES